MGQATVDLPDPQRAPLPSGGADDLLAQMAGAEIDRLLAEADSGQSSEIQQVAPVVYDEVPENKSVQSSAPTTVTADGLDESTTAAVRAEDSANSNSQTPAALPETTAAAVSDASDDPLAGELDALLATLTANDPPAVAAPPVPTPIAEVVAAEEAAAVPATAAPEFSVESAEILAATELHVAATGELSPETSDETSVAERSALASDPGIAEGLAADVPTGRPHQQFQFLLKPLEWINAPLNSSPDLLRELMGKAAILTAVNAAALMFYVHFIRRH